MKPRQMAEVRQPVRWGSKRVPEGAEALRLERLTRELEAEWAGRGA
jgi:hypothetical protein